MKTSEAQKMNPLATLRTECEKLLKQGLEKAYPGTELPDAKYSTPPTPDMGELSSPACFQLARTLRQPPMKIAETITQNIPVETSKLIEKSEAVGGYINFYTDTAEYSKLVLDTITGEDKEYGFIKVSEPQKVMVEHTSANPNSPLHIGNARNSILGDSIASLLEKRGHDVVIHFLVNDMGRQVAMATYGWKLMGKPEPVGTAELWVGTIYASVNVVMELTRLRAELKEAEEEGWVYEASEAQEQIEEYEKAAESLSERYPDIYKAMSEKLPKIADPMAEIVALKHTLRKQRPRNRSGSKSTHQLLPQRVPRKPRLTRHPLRQLRLRIRPCLGTSSGRRTRTPHEVRLRHQGHGRTGTGLRLDRTGLEAKRTMGITP